MPASKDFRELTAWQLAHQMDLRVEVFLACPEFRRYFKCCKQLGDAARAAPRHIAEGYERSTHQEFAHFVRMAKESEAAVLKQLVDAHGQRLITTDELTINSQLAKRAMRAASGLIRYLESTPEPASEQGHAEPQRRSKQAPKVRIHPADSVGAELHREERRHADDDRRERFAGARLRDE
jgi:four helix bundle protein